MGNYKEIITISKEDLIKELLKAYSNWAKARIEQDGVNFTIHYQIDGKPYELMPNYNEAREKVRHALYFGRSIKVEELFWEDGTNLEIHFRYL